MDAAGGAPARMPLELDFGSAAVRREPAEKNKHRNPFNRAPVKTLLLSGRARASALRPLPCMA